MAVIISDTGPLLAFAGINQLTILQQLFKTVWIPQAVWQESQAHSDATAQRIAIAQQQGWLEVIEAPIPNDFPVSLGDGEQEAMQLANAHANTLLIMDDRLARREALRRKLTFIGTVKVLWIAQQRQIIPDAAALLDAMALNGYYLSRQLLQQISE